MSPVYLVIRSIKCNESCYVEARSKASALRKAEAQDFCRHKDMGYDESGDWDVGVVTWMGKATAELTDLEVDYSDDSEC